MIKAIPTIYNGVEYRSRLEAQVACLLTNLNADFQYEPQGFDLGDGLKYLPDFFVTNNCAYESPSEHRKEKYDAYEGILAPKQFWIEVKGNFASKERDEEKVLKFANASFETIEACFNSNNFTQECLEKNPDTSGVGINSKWFVCNCKGGCIKEKCEEYHVYGDEWVIENPILIIDEIPPLKVLTNFNVLKVWCLKKSQDYAIGAEKIHAYSFKYLQEYKEWQAEAGQCGIYFKEYNSPCPCININGEFCVADSIYGGFKIDEQRTLDAYKKAHEVGKWSPR